MIDWTWIWSQKWRKGSSRGVSYAVSVLDNQVRKMGVGAGVVSMIELVFGGADWGGSRKWWCSGTPGLADKESWEVWWVIASLGLHKKFTNIRILTDIDGKYQESHLNACPQNAIILSLKHMGIQENSKKKTVAVQNWNGQRQNKDTSMTSCYAHICSSQSWV